MFSFAEILFRGFGFSLCVCAFPMGEVRSLKSCHCATFRKPRFGEQKEKMLVAKSLHVCKKSRPFRLWLVRIFSFCSAGLCFFFHLVCGFRSVASRYDVDCSSHRHTHCPSVRQGLRKLAKCANP